MTTPFTSSLINGELAGALLQAAFTTVGEAILSINSDSYIVMANPEIEHVFGYQPEELLGQHLHMLMPEKYREAHSAGLHRYLTTGVAQVLGVRLELEGLRKGGVVFPLEIRITPTLIKQQRFFTAAVRDISQRQEEELQIQDQQTRLERQNRQYNRAYHFFLFTLENMEIALRMGGDKEELINYLQQVKTTFKDIDKDTTGAD